jgi:hypothetical protein
MIFSNWNPKKATPSGINGSERRFQDGTWPISIAWGPEMSEMILKLNVNKF